MNFAGDVRILVDVQLRDGRTAVELGRQRIDGRRQTPARPAPFRPEIHEDHALS